MDHELLINPTSLPGVLLIQPVLHEDERGYFYESFNRQRFWAQTGLELDFVQANVSFSRRGVLRGLHYQRRYPQGKLIKVLHGCVFDVVADVNPASANYGRHITVQLSAENNTHLWVPPGYAHGFYVLSQAARVHYQCTQYYQPQDEAGVIWSCPRLAIDWPTRQPILSAKDSRLPELA